MSLLETLRVAVRALLRNKTRSFLTMLGIIIGVGAVIAMVAIGEGAKARVQETFAAMGSNMLIVMPGSTMSGGAHGGFGSQSSLTWDDLTAIRTEVASVKVASPQLRSAAQVTSDTLNWGTTINGVSPEYFDARGWSTLLGRELNEADQEAATKVAVLGVTVVEKLFGSGADPLGATVRVRNVPFEVVGVLEKKGQSPMGQDYDDVVLIPASTFATRIQGGMRRYLNGSIVVSATSETAVARAERDIRALLRDRHRLSLEAEDDFSVRNLAEIAAAQQEGVNTITTLLAAVALISLLIGGIGIMNIMLVSVTERTREIGLRMAVGAKPGHVLMQFLVEALTLSSVGGMMGIALGLLAAQRLAEQFGWPLLVEPTIIVISVVFSGMVGVVFGIYPARKASQLDPIEALRYE